MRLLCCIHVIDLINSLRASDAYTRSKIIIIGSDNGLSHGLRQAIIWTNVGILLVRPLGKNFSGNLIEINTFSFKKMHLKLLSAEGRLFCHGLNGLTNSTMHVSHTPRCTIQNRDVHISVLNGVLWDMEQMHGGICEIRADFVIISLTIIRLRHVGYDLYIC